jgi:hypothetical protein
MPPAREPARPGSRCSPATAARSPRCATLLPACPARDDLTCIATELATNAVTHTATGHGGWFTAELTTTSSRIRIAITDNGAPHGPHLINDPASEHGRGLHIVHALATRTGVHGDHHSRQTWAEIPWSTDHVSETRHIAEPATSCTTVSPSLPASRSHSSGGRLD